MELWEYILIVLAVEIVVVVVVLLVIWRYCKWSQSKKVKDEKNKRPIIPLATISDEDMRDLFSRNAVVEYSKAPSHHGSFRYSQQQRTRQLPVVEESPPSYRSERETSIRNSPDDKGSVASASKLRPKMVSSMDSLRSSPDSGVRVLDESFVSSRQNSLYDYPTSNKTESPRRIARPQMRASPEQEDYTVLKRAELERARVRFESLYLMKRARGERMPETDLDDY